MDASLRATRPRPEAEARPSKRAAAAPAAAAVAGSPAAGVRAPLPAAAAPAAAGSARAAAGPANASIDFFLLDLTELPGDTLVLWGVAAGEGPERTVCVKTTFRHYFWFPAPVRRGAEGPEASRLAPEDLDAIKAALNAAARGGPAAGGGTARPGAGRVGRVEVAPRTCILYYRPEGPRPFLRIEVEAGGDVRRLGELMGQLAGACSGPAPPAAADSAAAAGPAAGPALAALAGLRWPSGAFACEHESIKRQLRFLADAGLAGGCWIRAPRAGAVPAGASGRISRCDLELDLPDYRQLERLGVDPTLAHAGLPAQLPWGREDAGPAAESAAGNGNGNGDGAAGGAYDRMPPLRALSVSVQAAGPGGQTGIPSRDPISLIACVLDRFDFSNGGSSSSSSDSSAAAAVNGDGARARGGAPPADAGAPSPSGRPEAAAAANFAAAAAAAAWPRCGCARVVFSTRPFPGPPGVDVRVFPSEKDLLRAWQGFVLSEDPDLLITFQAKHSLLYLAERAKMLHVGPLDVGRARVADKAHGLRVKSVVSYNKEWVRNQQRMTNTSNQETFRATAEGRLALCMLRVISVSHNLNFFSLGECAAVFLGRTQEMLGPAAVAELWAGGGGAPGGEGGGGGPGAAAMGGAARGGSATPGKVKGPAGGKIGGKSPASAAKSPAGRGPALGGPGLASGSAPSSGADGGPPAGTSSAGTLAGTSGGPVRLAEYALAHASTARDLCAALHTVQDAIELARTTGLMMVEIVYKAQMARVLSVILRHANRRGFVLGGAVPGPTVESPFLIHPEETRTVGLHATVATMDFASLYPSMFIGHNLCYSTQVHPEDLPRLPSDDLFAAPTSAPVSFVRARVHVGVLPTVLRALIAARDEAKAKGKRAGAGTALAAILDRRQFALKLVANALYGFTGANASPLQMFTLADACLALGAQTCRVARAVLQQVAERAGGRVIYGQTDSLFLAFPGVSVAEATAIAREAAAAATASFPPPVELKFEKVFAPLLLLQVNRYAGLAFTDGRGPEQGGCGTLQVKGIETDRRDVPEFMRQLMGGVMRELLVGRSTARAAEFFRAYVRRLMGGELSMYDLIGTGGLWRADTADVRRAADSITATGAMPEGMRGPHLALAARLKTRDPSCDFGLGERIPYVLLAGRGAKQDDMAEDPVLALREDYQPNLEVYYTHKVKPPMRKVFEVILPPAELTELMEGGHTKLSSGLDRGAGGAGTAQAGLGRFFAPKAACLRCRRPTVAAPAGGGPEPPVCAPCLRDAAEAAAAARIDPATAQNAVIQQAYLERLDRVRAQELRHHTAASACAACRSGGLAGAHLCSNVACPALYSAVEAPRELVREGPRLRRFDAAAMF